MTDCKPFLLYDDASLIARIRAGLSTAGDADRVEAAMIRLRMCEEALAHIAAQYHCGHAFGAIRADSHDDEREQRDEALLRQALEALEYCRSGEDCHPTLTSEAIDALKERLK